MSPGNSETGWLGSNIRAFKDALDMYREDSRA